MHSGGVSLWPHLVHIHPEEKFRKQEGRLSYWSESGMQWRLDNRLKQRAWEPKSEREREQERKTENEREGTEEKEGGRSEGESGKHIITHPCGSP